MSGIRIDLKGEDALIKALSNMSDDIRSAVSMAVQETAAGMEADVKLKIAQGPATGRVYTRRSVSHQASSPGEAPASDTGVLLGSIYHEKDTDLTYSIGSRVDYAAFLEYGTTRMLPRPVWVPTAERVRGEFRADIAAAVSRETR